MLEIPINSKIENGFLDYHYGDCFSIELENDFPIRKITMQFLSTPKWINVLLRLRDILVTPFGLATAADFEKKRKENSEQYENSIQIGNTKEYFQTIEKNENEIIMGENDSHLNFRLSVIKEAIADSSKIKVSAITLVHFNNKVGRIYFTPVKPFHKIIVKRMLKNLRKLK